MDLFTQKLEEYGLEARKVEDEKVKLTTIFQQMEEELGSDPVNKLKEIIYGAVYILIADKEKFIQKMNFQKETEGKPSFILENLYIDVNYIKDELFLEYCENVEGQYDEKEMIAHLEKNKIEYEQLYPDWKVKKMFDPKADEKIVKVLHDEQIKFIEKVEESKSFVVLYNKLKKAVKKEYGMGI